MITALIAMVAMQMQPNIGSARTVAQPPGLATATLLGRKERMIAEGRALVVRAQRVNLSYAPAPGQPSKADLDSMSEMGEMESLRLQMAMDRLSKMMSTLSNLLKKASDTQQSIIQNIK